MKPIQPSLLLISFLLLSACGGGGGGGSDNSSSSTTGSVSFSATDAPVDDVTRVQVTFDGIALQPQGGERITIDFETPRVIENLLDLQGNASEPILEATDVPAGEYNFIRLFVIPNAPDSFVDEDDGSRQNLLIPGQQNNGNGNNRRFLQLNRGFTVPAGGNANFTIDFQLRSALNQPNGQNGDYFLRPSLRLINNVEVGTISGAVADALVMDANCTNDLAADEGNAVYLYAGSDASTGDVFVDTNGDPANPDSPLTTANVTQNSNSGRYEYTIGFIETGDYTVAFTCQGLDDNPTVDDDINFVQPANISVTAGQTTVQDFSAP